MRLRFATRAALDVVDTVVSEGSERCFEALDGLDGPPGLSEERRLPAHGPVRHLFPLPNGFGWITHDHLYVALGAEPEVGEPLPLSPFAVPLLAWVQPEPFSPSFAVLIVAHLGSADALQTVKIVIRPAHPPKVTIALGWSDPSQALPAPDPWPDRGLKEILAERAVVHATPTLRTWPDPTEVHGALWATERVVAWAAAPVALHAATSHGRLLTQRSDGELHARTLPMLPTGLGMGRDGQVLIRGRGGGLWDPQTEGWVARGTGLDRHLICADDTIVGVDEGSSEIVVLQRSDNAPAISRLVAHLREHAPYDAWLRAPDEARRTRRVAALLADDDRALVTRLLERPNEGVGRALEGALVAARGQGPLAEWIGQQYGHLATDVRDIVDRATPPESGLAQALGTRRTRTLRDVAQSPNPSAGSAALLLATLAYYRKETVWLGMPAARGVIGHGSGWHAVGATPPADLSGDPVLFAAGDPRDPGRWVLVAGNRIALHHPPAPPAEWTALVERAKVRGVALLAPRPDAEARVVVLTTIGRHGTLELLRWGGGRWDREHQVELPFAGPRRAALAALDGGACRVLVGGDAAWWADWCPPEAPHWRKLPGPPCLAVALSHDGTLACLGAASGAVMGWSLPEVRLRFVQRVIGRVQALEVGPQGRLAVTADGVWVLDRDGGRIWRSGLRPLGAAVWRGDDLGVPAEGDRVVVFAPSPEDVARPAECDAAATAGWEALEAAQSRGAWPQGELPEPVAAEAARRAAAHGLDPGRIPRAAPVAILRAAARGAPWEPRLLEVLHHRACALEGSPGPRVGLLATLLGRLARARNLSLSYRIDRLAGLPNLHDLAIEAAHALIGTDDLPAWAALTPEMERLHPWIVAAIPEVVGDERAEALAILARLALHPDLPPASLARAVQALDGIDHGAGPAIAAVFSLLLPHADATQLGLALQRAREAPVLGGAFARLVGVFGRALPLDHPLPTWPLERQAGWWRDAAVVALPVAPVVEPQGLLIHQGWAILLRSLMKRLEAATRTIALEHLFTVMGTVRPLLIVDRVVTRDHVQATARLRPDGAGALRDVGLDVVADGKVLTTVALAALATGDPDALVQFEVSGGTRSVEVVTRVGAIEIDRTTWPLPPSEEAVTTFDPFRASATLRDGAVRWLSSLNEPTVAWCDHPEAVVEAAHHAGLRVVPLDRLLAERGGDADPEAVQTWLKGGEATVTLAWPAAEVARRLLRSGRLPRPAAAPVVWVLPGVVASRFRLAARWRRLVLEQAAPSDHSRVAAELQRAADAAPSVEAIEAALRVWQGDLRGLREALGERHTDIEPPGGQPWLVRELETLDPFDLAVLVADVHHASELLTLAGDVKPRRARLTGLGFEPTDRRWIAAAHARPGEDPKAVWARLVGGDPLYNVPLDRLARIKMDALQKLWSDRAVGLQAVGRAWAGRGAPRAAIAALVGVPVASLVERGPGTFDAPPPLGRIAWLTTGTTVPADATTIAVGPGAPLDPGGWRGVVPEATLRAVLTTRRWPAAFIASALAGTDLAARSPFDAATALPPGSPLFKGREAEVARIERHLRRRHHLILGSRRIGKTSLLLHLYGRACRKADFAAWWVDAQGARTSADLGAPQEGFERRPAAGYVVGTPFLAQLDAWATRVNAAGLTPLLFLNEVDGLARHDRTFFERVRGIAEASGMRLVMVGYATLDRELRDPQSPFFHLTGGATDAIINLATLDPASAMAIADLLEEPPLGLVWATEADRERGREGIAAASFGIPWIVQSIAGRIVERLSAARRGVMTLDDVRRVCALQQPVLDHIEDIDLAPLAGATSETEARARSIGWLLVLVAADRLYLRGDGVTDWDRLASQPTTERTFSGDEARVWTEEVLRSAPIAPTDRDRAGEAVRQFPAEPLLRALCLTLVLAPSPVDGGERRFVFQGHIYPIELRRASAQGKTVSDRILHRIHELVLYTRRWN